MIRRPGHLAELQRLLRAFPVVAIVGARQAGKTTLAQMLMSERKVRSGSRRGSTRGLPENAPLA